MSKAGTEKRKSFGGLKALRHRMFGNKTRKHEVKPDVLSDDEANPRPNSDDLSKVLSPANRSQSHEFLAGDDATNQQNRDGDDNGRENETGETKSPVQSRIERLKNELSKQQQQRPISSQHSPPGRKSPKIKRLSHLPPAGLDQMLMKKGPPPVMGKKPTASSPKPACDEVKEVKPMEENKTNKTEEPTAQKNDEVEQDECKPTQTNAEDQDVTTTTITITTTTNPHNAAISRIAVRPKNRRAAKRGGNKRQKIVSNDEDVDDFFAISTDVKAVTAPLDSTAINESLADQQPSTNGDLPAISEEDAPTVECEEINDNNNESEEQKEDVAAKAETEKVDEIQKTTSMTRSSSKSSEAADVTGANELQQEDAEISAPQSNGLDEETKEEVSDPFEKSEDEEEAQSPPINVEDYKLKRDLSKIFEMTWNENRDESPTKNQGESKGSLSDLSEKNSPVEPTPPIIKTVDVEEEKEEKKDEVEEEKEEKKVDVEEKEEKKDEVVAEQTIKQEESEVPNKTPETRRKTSEEHSHKKNFLKLRMKKMTDSDRRKSSGSCLTPDAKDDAPRFSLSIDNLKSCEGSSSPTSLFPVRLKKTGRNLSESGVHDESRGRSASKTSLEATPESQSKSSILRSPKKLFHHNKKRAGDQNRNNNNISWVADEQKTQVTSPGSDNNSSDDVFANNRFKNHTSNSVTSIWDRDVFSVKNVPVIRESTSSPLSKSNRPYDDGHTTAAGPQRAKPPVVVLRPHHPTTVVVETKNDEPSSPKVPLVTLRRVKHTSNHKYGETKNDTPEWIAKAKRHSVTWEGKLDAQQQQQQEKKPLSSTKSEDYPRENTNLSKRLSVPVVKLAEDIFELKRASEETPTIVHQRPIMPALKPISPIKSTLKEQSITTQESITKNRGGLTSPTNSKSTVPSWMEMALKKQKDWKEAKFV